MYNVIDAQFVQNIFNIITIGGGVIFTAAIGSTLVKSFSMVGCHQSRFNRKY